MIRLLNIPILNFSTFEETKDTLTIALDKIQYIIWNDPTEDKAIAEIYTHDARYVVDAVTLKTWLLKVTC